jgi:mannitol/fructose-specific phosphotransferase system IIA component (Ntr-type)
MNRLFQPELVKIVDGFETKSECLTYMTALLAESGCLNFPDRFLAAVQGSEDIMSTGIGKGVAIPHARDLTVTCIKVAVCLVHQPLEYESVDDLPVQLVFMIAVPQSASKEYMKILRSLSEYLRQSENRNALINATSETELYHDVLKIEKIIADSINA